MAFDPRCYELAQAFLADEPKSCRTEVNTRILAQHIQESIEELLEDLRDRREARA